MSTSETQLRNISTRSAQLQATASSTAEQVLQQQQESQRTQQTQQTSQQSGLTPAQVEQFVMYPWGDEFARLPQSVQAKFEQMHQDYIGGATERKNAILTQTDVLKAVYGLQTGEIKPVYETTTDTTKTSSTLDLVPSGNIQERIRTSGGGDIILNKGQVFSKPKESSLDLVPSGNIQQQIKNNVGGYDLTKQDIQSSINKNYVSNNNLKEGYMYEKQIDTERGIPVYRTYKIENGKERLATKEEQKDYREQTREVQTPKKLEIDTSKGFIFGGGLELSQQELQKQRDIAYTKSVRGDDSQKIKQLFIGAGSSLVGTGLFFKSLITEPIETIKSIPSGVVQTFNVFKSGAITKTLKQEPTFALGFVGAEVGQQVLIGKAMSSEFTLFGKSPKQVLATSEFEKAVKPFSRQRATLILKTEDGKYVLGRTETGDIISIGGGIEAGQTSRQAVLSELSQETGLSLKDLRNFKSKGKIVTPEESFKIFVATISKENLKKIVPSSDLVEIKLFSPSQINKVTGQTAKYPVRLPSGIRSYEAGIINWLETGKKPTLLKVDTSMGEFYLGTQSRYNVPYKQQSKYLKTEELTLTHGTTKPPVLNRFFNPIKKKFEVIAEKTKRGQAEGLYLQPPVSSKGIKAEVIKLADYTGKGIIVKNIKELPFNVPTKSPSGYVGLSYAGFGSNVEESLGITFKKPKRTIYTLREKPISPIGKTPKTLSGAESELIIAPDTMLRTLGKSERFKIENKKVFFQPVEIIKDTKIVEQINRLRNIADTGSQTERLSALKKLSSLTSIDYTAGKLTYINPLSITSKTIIPFGKDSTEEISPEKKIVQREKVLEFFPTPSETKKETYRRETTKIPEYEPLKIKAKEIIKVLETPKKEVYRSSEIIKSLREKYPIKPEKRTPYVKPPKSREVFPSKRTAKEQVKDMIDVFRKDKGIFTKVGEAETPYLAGQLLKKKLLENLSASGYAEKKGKKISFKDLGIGSFAEPSKKKGFEFIAVQRKKAPLFSGRLSSFGERRAIRQAKKSKKKRLSWFD